VLRSRIAGPAEPRRNGLMFESQVWLTNCFGKRLAATCYFTRRKTVARLEISQILSLKYALADFPPQLLQAQQQAYSFADWSLKHFAFEMEQHDEAPHLWYAVAITLFSLRTERKVSKSFHFQKSSSEKRPAAPHSQPYRLVLHNR
jgi:hypothetical protein